MEHDTFLRYLFTTSPLSDTSKRIYAEWVTRCCQHSGKVHLLDVTPEEICAFRDWLLSSRQYSPASDTIVFNALRHVYAVLLPKVDPASAERYAHLFTKQPRQTYRLPQTIDIPIITRFLNALPNTAAGNIIRMIYASGKTFDAVTHGRLQWKCNRNYAAHVCAKAARSVGIPHGFGLSGVRSVGIVHRIQARTSDTDLRFIQEESGLSASQFRRYLQVSGVLSV